MIGATFVAAVLTGCTLQLASPKVELVLQAAYPSGSILIPYEFTGDGSIARARWALRHYRTDVAEWELLDSGQISVPNGSAGILRLDLDDGRYELTAELLTSRGLNNSITAPGLTEKAEFYVDTNPPWGFISLDDDQGGVDDPLPGYDPSLGLEIYPTYEEPPDLDVESPVQLYYFVDSTVPPSIDQDPSGDTIPMWDGGELSYNRVLSIVAIDQAGNVGSFRLETYTAP